MNRSLRSPLRDSLRSVDMTKNAMAGLKFCSGWGIIYETFDGGLKPTLRFSNGPLVGLRVQRSKLKVQSATGGLESRCCRDGYSRLVRTSCRERRLLWLVKDLIGGGF